jgi:hypothetical protein
MVEPADNVKSFEPRFNKQEVSVNAVPVAFRVMLLLSERPVALVLLAVSAFSCVTLDGMLTPADAPVKLKFEKFVVTRFVGVPAIAGPFNTNVFGVPKIPPTSYVPAVSVNNPVTVRDALVCCKVPLPAVLFTVKVPAVTSPFPVICGVAVPL